MPCKYVAETVLSPIGINGLGHAPVISILGLLLASLSHVSLQVIQNTAAKTIFLAHQSNHITSLFVFLHSLLLHHCNKSKLLGLPINTLPTPLHCILI